MDDVKIFGERNTATNALKQIIESNSESHCCPATKTDLGKPFGPFQTFVFKHSPRWGEALIDRAFEGVDASRAWKHCATDFRTAADLAGKTVFFCVRHPGSWLLSIFRNHYHAIDELPTELGEFINYSWRTVKRERLGKKRYTPLDLYMKKLESYRHLIGLLEMDDIDYRFVRFEDVVLAQGRMFSELRPLLKNPTNEFCELRKSTKSATKTLIDYQNYYGAEHWREELAGLENTINNRVDWDMLARFDYKAL
jgi:hypothetical protein